MVQGRRYDRSQLPDALQDTQSGERELLNPLLDMEVQTNFVPVVSYRTIFPFVLSVWYNLATRRIKQLKVR